MFGSFDDAGIPPTGGLSVIIDGEFVPVSVSTTELDTNATQPTVAAVSQSSAEQARAVLADREPYELNGFGD